MAPGLARVRELQATPVGVFIETPIQRIGDPESPLAHFLANALRYALSADVAIHRGGLRADIPAGNLTFGHLYAAFPFDNRVSRVTLSGDELRRVFAEEIRRRRQPRSLAIAGVLVKTGCTGERLDVELLRPNGRRVDPEERLVVVGMDSLVASLIFTTIAPPPDVGVSHTAPILREVVEDWWRRRAGQLASAQFIDPDHPRWELPDTVLTGCVGLDVGKNR
jgi:hypothetical protein